jgi:hypothetical protein
LLSAGFGFAAFLPAELWFFLAQRGSRIGQFPPFRMAPSLVRLAEYATANLFGGLPLYVGGWARMALGAALGLAAVGLVGLVVWRWRLLVRDTRWLLLACTLAPPLGLLALGAVFDSTPIELRYLCFATPFAALLLADAFGGEAGGVTAIRAGLLTLQALAIAGLILRPETMQPARAAARTAAALAGSEGVIVLPRGNDGVGVVGPFLAELPDTARLLLVFPKDDVTSLRARVPPGPVVLAPLGEDATSRAAIGVMRAAFPGARSSP